jgi:hypothetical protein
MFPLYIGFPCIKCVEFCQEPRAMSIISVFDYWMQTYIFILKMKQLLNQAWNSIQKLSGKCRFKMKIWLDIFKFGWTFFQYRLILASWYWLFRPIPSRKLTSFLSGKNIQPSLESLYRTTEIMGLQFWCFL